VAVPDAEPVVFVPVSFVRLAVWLAADPVLEAPVSLAVALAAAVAPDNFSNPAVMVIVCTAPTSVPVKVSTLEPGKFASLPPALSVQVARVVPSRSQWILKEKAGASVVWAS